MHRICKAAAVATMLGGLGLAGIGTASASDHGRQAEVGQAASCTSHDLNADVAGEVGVLNGAAGNLLNGEGNSGGQATAVGSTAGCGNDAF